MPLMQEILIYVAICSVRLCCRANFPALFDTYGWVHVHVQGAQKSARDSQRKQASDYAEFKGHGACVAFLELNTSKLV